MFRQFVVIFVVLTVVSVVMASNSTTQAPVAKNATQSTMKSTSTAAPNNQGNVTTAKPNSVAPMEKTPFAVSMLLASLMGLVLNLA